MQTLYNEVKDILDSQVDETNDYLLEDVLSDLNQGGCESGFIGELIYYSDTERFYKRHEDEIESLLDELGYSRDHVCNGDFNLTHYMNNASWIAFEVTAQQFGE